MESRIPLLSEHNFAEWCYYIKQALVLKGLASAIDPDCTVPGDLIKSLKGSVTGGQIPAVSGASTSAETATTTTVTADQMIAVRAVINERALALIRATVSFNCAHLIGGDHVSAMDAWLNLESAFASKLKARVAALKLELQSIKLGKRSVSEYVGAVIRLSTELKAAGGTITDAELQATVLAGLPETYQSVVAVLSEQALTTAELLARLQLAEGRRKKATPSPPPAPPSGQAHASMGRRSDQPPSKKRMSPADYKKWLASQKCRHCGVKGHLWKDCARRLREEAMGDATGGIALANSFASLAM